MSLLLLLTFFGFSPTVAQAEIISPITIEYSSSTAELILESYAAKYHLAHPEQFVATAKCESHFDEDAWNKSDPNGGSKGVFQFQAGTFAQYSKLAGIQGGSVWSPWDSADTAAYMFSKGLQDQWSCYRHLFGSTKS